MSTIPTCRPEGNLYQDAYLGKKEVLHAKLAYLSRIAEPERWDFKKDKENPKYTILFNYLLYTYDRIKQEGKIAVSDDGQKMCFNTGLQTQYGNDIFAFFGKSRLAAGEKSKPWFLIGFNQRTDSEMKHFKSLPDIADYFTNPADFIYDKNLKISLDYDHIIDDNKIRFVQVGLTEDFIIKALLENAVRTVTDRLKRNFKVAIPQFYTEKSSQQAKIQLLVPLCLRAQNVADLALVLDKTPSCYVGKTILTLEWSYMNSRRIVKPDVEWLTLI